MLERDGAFLLVQRRHPPDAGLWGYPGGKIEGGETIAQAAVRELHEETGVQARARGLLTPFEVLRRDGDGRLLAHFILLPVLCTWIAGTGSASSDAQDAGWFRIQELLQRPERLCEHVVDLARSASAR